MVRHGSERVKADAALADGGVAVLVGAERVLRVVQVDGAQAVEPDHAIELLQHAVQIAGDVVAAVPHVAGVQAHAHFLVQFHGVDDGGQLFKTAADLRALACHGFKQQRGGLLGRNHLIQRIGDERDARLGALAHMAARMHVVQLAGGVFHTHEVVG